MTALGPACHAGSSSALSGSSPQAATPSHRALTSLPPLHLCPHRWCCSPRGWRTMPSPSATRCRPSTAASCTACTARPVCPTRCTPASRCAWRWVGVGGQGHNTSPRGAALCVILSSEYTLEAADPTHPCTRPLPHPPPPTRRTCHAWAATCAAPCWSTTHPSPSSTSRTMASRCCSSGAPLPSPPGPPAASWPFQVQQPLQDLLGGGVVCSGRGGVACAAQPL